MERGEYGAASMDYSKIQELDPSTDMRQKIKDAQKKLEEAKKIATEIIEGAKADIDSVKQKVATAVDSDITHLNKSLDEMMKVETSKAKKEVVTEVLEELLSSENIKLTQQELANIVLKKVA